MRYSGIRRCSRRISRFLRLAALCVASLVTTELAYAEDRAVLLHWNDFHGQVLPVKRASGEQQGGIRALIDYVDGVRAEVGDEMLLVDAGDWFQGTPEGNLTDGKFVFDLFNAAGVDVTCVGNHDYDFGEDVLIDLIGRARFPVLGANIVDAEGKIRSYVKPTWVTKVNGITLGFIGLLTPDTPRIVRQDVGKKLRVANPVDTCQQEIPKLREQGVEFIVVLSHLGIDLERHLAKAVPELDLIIGGHSHTTLPEPEVTESGVVLAQAGAKGSFVGRLEITRAAGGDFQISGGLVPIVARTEPVRADVEAIIAEYQPTIDAEMERTVGTLPEALVPPERGGSPSSTPLGNWLADAIARAGNAPIGLHNRGGIRAELPAGDVTVRDLFQLSPFGNAVVTCEMTGKALREVISTSIADPSVRLEVSGLEVEWSQGAEGPELVEVRHDGEKLDPLAIYRVATNDYLALGGDGWTQFLERGDPVSAGFDVMEATLRDFERGPIVVSGEKRIRPASLGAERFMGVLGLFVMLAICWVFSKHRRSINLWTVCYGMGLQLLLAVIILGLPSVPDASFYAMGVLLALILCYLADTTLGQFDDGVGRPLAWGLGLVAGAALVGFCHWLELHNLTRYILGISTIVFVVGAIAKHAHVVRGAFVVVLTSGYARLLVNEVDGRQCFDFLSSKVKAFLELTNAGSAFLFGNLANGAHFFPGPEAGWPGFGFQFAFSVLPTIIFFSAFMSVMYYLGVVQFVIGAISKFMRWSMRTSGSETLSCSANIFVGQTEAPFMVKPFLQRMTHSELHAVMVGGFATVAGGVLAAYIGMGVNPGHLLAASVMSAPAAILIAKILFPETEKSETAGDVEVPKIETADNVVGAASNGVTDGLKLALNVGAMLIGFIALVAFVDVVLGGIDAWLDPYWASVEIQQLTRWGFTGELQANGEYAGIIPGSLKTLFGTVFKPLAWLMGVSWQEAGDVGALMGTKISVNEFVAYADLQSHITNQDISPRSIVIATYALCGFANFSSIGIQIGGIGALAPERRGELAKLAPRAMFGGALASWMTATIAGILYV